MILSYSCLPDLAFLRFDIIEKTIKRNKFKSTKGGAACVEVAGAGLVEAEVGGEGEEHFGLEQLRPFVVMHTCRPSKYRVGGQGAMCR